MDTLPTPSRADTKDCNSPVVLCGACVGSSRVSGGARACAAAVLRGRAGLAVCCAEIGTGEWTSKSWHAVER